MPIAAFIFDLDGVLTDTAEHHFQAWMRLADEEGIPFSRQDNEALRGISRRESLERLLKGRAVSDEEAEALMSRKNAYYLERISRLSPADLLPGVDDMLGEIRAAGLRVGVASVSRNAAQAIQAIGLKGRFDVLCDGHSVQRHKPAPDLFLHTAEKLGVRPEECVVVEDAAAGIQAGRAAGMRTVGLGPHERVGEADLVLASLEGVRLRDILQALELRVSRQPGA